MFVTPAFAVESTAGAEGTHTETGVPNGGAHESVFPPFDPSTFSSQILWLAITFGLFYLFLKRVVLPRIAGTLEVRRDRIAQDFDQAARMKDEADAARAAYEQELATARAEAGGIAQEARDAAKAEAEAERQETGQALDKKLAEAEAHIAGIKAEAMKDVGKIAEETTAALVEQLIGKASKAEVAAAVKAAS